MKYILFSSTVRDGNSKKIILRTIFIKEFKRAQDHANQFICIKICIKVTLAIQGYFM